MKKDINNIINYNISLIKLKNLIKTFLVVIKIIFIIDKLEVLSNFTSFVNWILYYKLYTYT